MPFAAFRVGCGWLATQSRANPVSAPFSLLTGKNTGNLRGLISAIWIPQLLSPKNPGTFDGIPCAFLKLRSLFSLRKFPVPIRPHDPHLIVLRLSAPKRPPSLLSNVRFRRKSGHHVLLSPCPVLTQSGH
jgi:hypothetical protein